MHFNSFAPWRIKTARFKDLFHGSVKMCRRKAFLNQQRNKITLPMSWGCLLSCIYNKDF